MLYILFWLVAVYLVVAGFVKATKGQVALGVVMIIGGFLIGPGGASIWGH